MKNLVPLIAFSLAVLGSFAQLHAQFPKFKADAASSQEKNLFPVPKIEADVTDSEEPNLTGSQILQELKAKQGKELNDYITAVARKVDNLQLSDEEIDLIIARLMVIQKSDPYQQQVGGFKGDTHRTRTKFPNRETAKSALYRFKFQKVANGLRKLPLEERVNKIIAGIEQPPGEGKLFSASSYARELQRAGSEAVPFIVQHQIKESYHRQAVVEVLATLGDPRAIDYIIEILNTPGDDFARDRPLAANALAKFDDERVVESLVKALQDDTNIIGGRFQTQISLPGDKSYLARYFSVRHKAAQSLTQITGRDWGLLFNEDHVTWSAWLHARDRDAFTPVTVERSGPETAELVTALYHAYMSGRPPSATHPKNKLATEEGIQALAEDLKQLGPGVVPLIVKEYQARVQETPNWHDMLQDWTKELLQAFDRDDAQKAAKTLIN